MGFDKTEVPMTVGTYIGPSKMIFFLLPKFFLFSTGKLIISHPHGISLLLNDTIVKKYGVLSSGKEL